MSLNEIVFDKSSIRLAKAIKHASELQAMYAYNIANSSVKGFKPLRFNEELQKAQMKYDKNFNIESEMAKMTENRMKHSALVKVLAAKIQIAKKIYTLGKGG